LKNFFVVGIFLEHNIKIFKRPKNNLSSRNKKRCVGSEEKKNSEQNIIFFVKSIISVFLLQLTQRYSIRKESVMISAYSGFNYLVYKCLLVTHDFFKIGK